MSYEITGIIDKNQLKTDLEEESGRGKPLQTDLPDEYPSTPKLDEDKTEDEKDNERKEENGSD